jgi:membrane protease YdiL (CAAX protease family)
MAQLIRRHPLTTFFVLAFGITWVVWVPRAVGAQLGVVGQVSTWAPVIAALLAAALTGGRDAVKELGARLVRWRVGWQWYLVVILGPAAFSLAVAGVYTLFGGSWSAAAPLALREGPLVLLPLFLLLLTFTDGLGEELAWRGFALPRLLTRYNAFVASLVLGVLWGLWHLPLFWTEGAPQVYQQPVWLFLVDITAKSVLFTWVFLHTRGSVLLAMLLHGATNLFGVSPDLSSTGDLTLPLLAAGAKWLLVIALILTVGPRLARGPRPEALPGTTATILQRRKTKTTKNQSQVDNEQTDRSLDTVSVDAANTDVSDGVDPRLREDHPKEER